MFLNTNPLPLEVLHDGECVVPFYLSDLSTHPLAEHKITIELQAYTNKPKNLINIKKKQTFFKMMSNVCLITRPVFLKISMQIKKRD